MHLRTLLLACSAFIAACSAKAASPDDSSTPEKPAPDSDETASSSSDSQNEGEPKEPATPAIPACKFTPSKGPSGELDTTFANGFTNIPGVVGTGNFRAAGLKADAQGRLLVLGDVLVSGLTAEVIVFRFSKDGVLDASFGDGGVAIVEVSVGEDRAFDLTFDVKDRIIVVGQSQSQSFIIRLTPQGELDPSFNASSDMPGTLVEKPKGGTARASSVAALGEDIYVGGSISPKDASTPSGFLDHVLPDGTVDTSWSLETKVPLAALVATTTALFATTGLEVFAWDAKREPSPTFGKSGIANGTGSSRMLVRKDGRLLMTSRSTVMGLTSAGTTDATFASFKTTGVKPIVAVGELCDGRVLVTTHHIKADKTSEVQTTILSNAGVVDTTRGDAGALNTSVDVAGTVTENSWKAAFVDPKTGKVTWLFGSTDPRILLFRVNP